MKNRRVKRNSESSCSKYNELSIFGLLLILTGISFLLINFFDSSSSYIILRETTGICYFGVGWGAVVTDTIIYRKRCSR